MKNILATGLAAALFTFSAAAHSTDDIDLELHEFSEVAVQELDANGNERLDPDEFAELMSDAPLPPSFPIERAFAMADLDANGGVSSEELYRFLLVMDAASSRVAPQ